MSLGSIPDPVKDFPGFIANGLRTGAAGKWWTRAGRSCPACGASSRFRDRFVLVDVQAPDTAGFVSSRVDWSILAPLCDGLRRVQGLACDAVFSSSQPAVVPGRLNEPADLFARPDQPHRMPVPKNHKENKAILARQQQWCRKPSALRLLALLRRHPWPDAPPTCNRPRQPPLMRPRRRRRSHMRPLRK